MGFVLQREPFICIITLLLFNGNQPFLKFITVDNWTVDSVRFLNYIILYNNNVLLHISVDIRETNNAFSLQDLVAWVTLGTHHIPHKENIPNTNTIGSQLSFFLLPFNYFDEDQSMRSRDSVRVDPTDKKRPTEGATVQRFHDATKASCKPVIKRPDERLKRNSTFLFT